MNKCPLLHRAKNGGTRCLRFVKAKISKRRPHCFKAQSLIKHEYWIKCIFFADWKLGKVKAARLKRLRRLVFGK